VPGVSTGNPVPVYYTVSIPTDIVPYCLAASVFIASVAIGASTFSSFFGFFAFTACAPTNALIRCTGHLGSIIPNYRLSVLPSHSFLCRRTNHRQQPPNGITRLRADTEPVLCTHCVELYIFYWLSDATGGRFRDGVVGADYFYWFCIAGGSAAVSV
jgi:hypothetical protein